MTQVDQFESVFRSAIKDVFEYEKIKLDSALVVCDLAGSEAASFTESIQSFLASLDSAHLQWHQLTSNDFQTTGDLLEKCAQIDSNIIFTYRNLHSKGWRFPHSMGEHLDVLLQRTSQPVMVLPHPEAGYAGEHAMKSTKRVMAVTDHLSNDHQLVNYASHFTRPNGHLYLTHLEDEGYFNRVMNAISKIPSIDTEQSEKLLRERLLKGPHDYIQSCKNTLAKSEKKLHAHEIVGFGHRLSDYKHYIDHYRVDLLVMHTKDEDQLAMHGLAYPLAIEIRQIPLLML